MDNTEILQKLEETQTKYEELKRLVESHGQGLKNWDDFQLKEPLDAYSQRIIENYGGGDVTESSTTTFTNKRITKRVGSTTSTASLTVDSDSYDIYRVTALAAAITVNAPSGTPTDGQPLLLTFKDNATARAFTWNAIFRIVGTTLPTTTVISKYTVIGCVYNLADTKWDVMMALQEI
jgi:hypothetical protein